MGATGMTVTGKAVMGIATGVGAGDGVRVGTGAGLRVTRRSIGGRFAEAVRGFAFGCFCFGCSDALSRGCVVGSGDKTRRFFVPAGILFFEPGGRPLPRFTWTVTGASGVGDGES